LVIRHRFGAGTPRQAAATAYFTFFEYRLEKITSSGFGLPSGAMHGTKAGGSSAVFICLLASAI
jgi:hypothetical protein